MIFKFKRLPKKLPNYQISCIISRPDHFEVEFINGKPVPEKAYLLAREAAKRFPGLKINFLSEKIQFPGLLLVNYEYLEDPAFFKAVLEILEDLIHVSETGISWDEIKELLTLARLFGAEF